MSDFYYEARDEAGQSISGRIRAMDVKDAIRQLEANQWEVVSVRTVPRGDAEPDLLPDASPPGEDAAEDSPQPVDEVSEWEWDMPPLTRRDSVEIAGHLADVMQSGLPLAQGLSALAKELPDGRIRRGLRAMVSQLEAGRSLEVVLESRHVPPDLRGLVRVGLQSGHTGEVLSQYVRHMQQFYDLRRQIALAWGYPLVLIVLAGLILLLFLLYLVPQFADIYDDFGTELPAMTQSLVWLSRTLQEYWPVMAVVIFVLAVLLPLLWRYALEPAQRRRFLWCLPIVGNMIRSAAMARFARLLGLMIENHLPLPEALRLAGQGAADAELGEAAMYLADVVESGRPLRGNKYACGRFPATFVQLLSQVDGQQPKAGAIHTLAEACLSSARMFESQARVAAARIAALCQPFIVIFTGCTVGYFVIALFLPLVKLLNDLS